MRPGVHRWHCSHEERDDGKTFHRSLLSVATSGSCRPDREPSLNAVNAQRRPLRTRPECRLLALPPIGGQCACHSGPAPSAAAAQGDASRLCAAPLHAHLTRDSPWRDTTCSSSLRAFCHDLRLCSPITMRRRVYRAPSPWRSREESQDCSIRRSHMGNHLARVSEQELKSVRNNVILLPVRS